MIQLYLAVKELDRKRGDRQQDDGEKSRAGGRNQFHHDFDGIDFTVAVVGGRFAYLLRCNYWKSARSMADLKKNFCSRMA
jgi:hypothetical protein